MKKFLYAFIVFIAFSNISFAYTSGFEYMINSLEIPKQNVNGYLINEEIYNVYNLIVYGNPHIIKTNQRWKETDEGKWEYGKSIWKGDGIKGEYWILGENEIGKEVHNELFPDDYISGKSPLEWNYISISDAEESWIDTSTYHSEIQIEYMMNQKLSRKGITYDLTVNDLGLNKARVENFATWKTAGSVYTKNLRNDGVVFSATFNIPPMAANAEIKSKLEINSGWNYKMPKDEKNLIIPIEYGALVENLSEYVTENDIKNIESELIIDGISIQKINNKETLKIEDTYYLNIDKSLYENQSVIEILVKTNAVAETYFESDIPFYSSKEDILVIKIEKEDDFVEVNDVNKRYGSGDKPKIVSIEFKRVTTNERGTEEYVDLNIAKKTNREFICAGQVLYIKVGAINTDNVDIDIEGDKSIRTLDELTKKFEFVEPKARNIKTRYNSLKSLQKAYDFPKEMEEKIGIDSSIKYFTFVYVIPYETKQTLSSWSSIREETRDAFKINKNELFEQIRDPYSFVFKASSEIGIVTSRRKLDVFEAWNTIYNRDLTPYIK